MVNKKTHQGLTLLELLLYTSIFFFIAFMVVPAFGSLIERQRGNSAVSGILAAHQYAREKAVTSNQHIHVCGSNSLTQCERLWKNFFVVFIDEDGNHHPSENEIIHAQRLSLSGASIESYLATGRIYNVLKPDGSVSFSGGMIYCPEDNDRSMYRKVTWNQMGRPYLNMDRNGDGIVDGIKFSNLRCRTES